MLTRCHDSTRWYDCCSWTFALLIAIIFSAPSDTASYNKAISELEVQGPTSTAGTYHQTAKDGSLEFPHLWAESIHYMHAMRLVYNFTLQGGYA